MKADLDRGTGGNPEPEALRSLLRTWRAPAPPAEIERGLREAFRAVHRRRPATAVRRVLWLSLAAGLALVGLSRLWPGARPAPPAVLDGLAAIAPPRASLPTPGVSDRRGRPLADVAAPSAVAPAVRGRQQPGGVAEGEVITEPGQAELLAELARSLRGVHQVQAAEGVPRAEALPPGAAEATLEGAPPAEPPEYRSEWVAVSGEWPPTRRAETGGGR